MIVALILKNNLIANLFKITFFESQKKFDGDETTDFMIKKFLGQVLIVLV